MKKMFTPLVVLLFLLISSKGFSQIVWTFSDSTGTPASNSFSGIAGDSMTSHNNTGTVTATITQTSASKNYSDASGTFNLGAAADTGGLSANSSYFEFTLTPVASTSVVLNSISFGTRSTGTGPRAFSIRTSQDAFTDNIASDTIGNTSSWVLKQKTDLNIIALAGVAVTVRIYGFNGTGNRSAGTINWRIDDVTINGSVLPLLLTNFSSSVVGNKVLLSWTTANETNMKGFSVEKSSDAKNFGEINYTAASGKGAYNAQDALSSGISYYRLKMVNQDGSFSYSKNVVVNANTFSSSALHVYPNPVSSNAVVSHPQAGANASLRITDLNGRVLQSYPLQQNAVQTTINVSKLMSGTYLLIYRDAAGKAASTRIMKN